jgi:hypothetical protein
MAQEQRRLKLGKRASFVKTHLKELPREKETWEADFRALPKPITQSETHYLGMVVAPDGSFLADHAGLPPVMPRSLRISPGCFAWRAQPQPPRPEP